MHVLRSSRLRPFVFRLALIASVFTVAGCGGGVSTTPALSAFTVANTTLALLAAGASATTTITDPSGYRGAYTATSANPAVATATVTGSTVTVTGVAAGTTTIAVSDTNARSASIAVQVTVTALPLQ